MRFRRILNIVTILVTVPGLSFVSGCVQKDDYHQYLSKKFEMISSDKIDKGWVSKAELMAQKGRVEKDTYNSRDALVACEKSLRESRPAHAFGLSIQNFILECMDEKGFVYAIEEAIWVH